MDQREIRGWFDTQLIVGGYRGQTQASPVGRVPLDHPLTQRLLDSHLVRTNRRGGTTWFELAHDRLIDPVKRDNREWRREHGTPLELAADAWISRAASAARSSSVTTWIASVRSIRGP